MKRNLYFKACIKFCMNLFLCSLFLYLLLYISPGNPALFYLRKHNIPITAESLKNAQIQLGLSGHFFKDYCNWLLNILSGNLGVSFTTGESVAKTLIARFRITSYEVLIGFFVSFPLSIIIGFIVGYIENKKIYKILLIILTCILSIPIYWLALLFIYFLGVKIQLFPFVGSQSFKHLVLPVLANVIPSTALASKLIAELVKNIRNQENHQMAKFRGIDRAYRLYYVFVDLSIPLITIISYIFLGLLGGTYLIEQIFSISGLGKVLLDAIYSRDYPLVLAAGLFTSFITFFIYFLSDLMIIHFSKQSTEEVDSNV